MEDAKNKERERERETYYLPLPSVAQDAGCGWRRPAAAGAAPALPGKDYLELRWRCRFAEKLSEQLEQENVTCVLPQLPRLAHHYRARPRQDTKCQCQ